MKVEGINTHFNLLAEPDKDHRTVVTERVPLSKSALLNLTPQLSRNPLASFKGSELWAGSLCDTVGTLRGAVTSSYRCVMGREGNDCTEFGRPS